MMGRSLKDAMSLRMSDVNTPPTAAAPYRIPGANITTRQPSKVTFVVTGVIYFS